MKRVYFAISYNDRYKFDTEIKALVEKAKQHKIDVFVFVDHFNFKNNQEKKMMQVAFDTIDNSAFLIAELTHKSIGVGIEVGYAFAKNKPILYIRKKGSPYSTTTAGCSDFSIEYENEVDLVEQILPLLKTNTVHSD